jgi:hypothetical protein
MNWEGKPEGICEGPADKLGALENDSGAVFDDDFELSNDEDFEIFLRSAV